VPAGADALRRLTSPGSKASDTSPRDIGALLKDPPHKARRVGESEGEDTDGYWDLALDGPAGVSVPRQPLPLPRPLGPPAGPTPASSAPADTRSDAGRAPCRRPTGSAASAWRPPREGADPGALGRGSASPQAPGPKPPVPDPTPQAPCPCPQPPVTGLRGLQCWRQQQQPLLQHLQPQLWSLPCPHSSTAERPCARRG